MAAPSPDGGPGRRKTGPKPLVDDEIQDLCFELKATRGWSYDRIAEHLLAKHGIGSGDPIGPVHRSTILRWIQAASEELTKEQAYRRDVETALAGRELDDLKEMLFDERSRHMVTTFDDVVKFIDTALKIRRERSSTFGLYAPKQKEVTYSGDVELDIDPDTATMLFGLQRFVEEERARKQGNGTP